MGRLFRHPNGFGELFHVLADFAQLRGIPRDFPLFGHNPPKKSTEPREKDSPSTSRAIAEPPDGDPIRRRSTDNQNLGRSSSLKPLWPQIGWLGHDRPEPPPTGELPCGHSLRPLSLSPGWRSLPTSCESTLDQANNSHRPELRRESQSRLSSSSHSRTLCAHIVA